MASKENENRDKKEKAENKEKTKKESNSQQQKVENEKKSEKVISKKETTEEDLKKKKKQMKIIIIITILCVIVLLFSIIFALININKTTYMSGISIHGIDISGMNTNEAKQKIEEKTKTELKNTINIMYENENIITIKPEEIEFVYGINDKLKEAYLIGRNGNIFKNNYEILLTAIAKKDLDLKYTYNKEKLQEIINSLDPNIPGLVTNPSYYIEKEELIIVPGTDGIAIEKEKLLESIIYNIINITSEKDENGEYVTNIEIPVIEKQSEKIDIDKIYQEVYCEPKNAYYVEEPFELYLDEDGIDFAITMEEAKEIISIESEEYKIPLKITKAERTINDIDSSAFRYKISEFTTAYDAGYTSRVNNLQLAAGKINGKVIGPGEIFSFNEVVGKRTIEAGYTDAKIFVNGEVVDGTGGGICQISTTLYNAVLLANLQVTDRRNHNYTTSYVKAGRDATVVYGAIDFKFQNNRKYPIKIEASVKGGIVTFSIYGVQEENEYEVKIIPVVTETIPKTTQYIDDATLVEGSEVVKQVGSSGCKVTTYKEVYLNGTLVSKDIISNDTYKVMPRIVRRGTMKASIPVVSQPVVETSSPTPTPEPEKTPEVQQPSTIPETVPTTPEEPEVPSISETTN